MNNEFPHCSWVGSRFSQCFKNAVDRFLAALVDVCPGQICMLFTPTFTLASCLANPAASASKPVLLPHAFAISFVVPCTPVGHCFVVQCAFLQSCFHGWPTPNATPSWVFHSDLAMPSWTATQIRKCGTTAFSFKMWGTRAGQNGRLVNMPTGSIWMDGKHWVQLCMQGAFSSAGAAGGIW